MQSSSVSDIGSLAPRRDDRSRAGNVSMISGCTLATPEVMPSILTGLMSILENYFPPAPSGSAAAIERRGIASCHVRVLAQHRGARAAGGTTLARVSASRDLASPRIDGAWTKHER